MPSNMWRRSAGGFLALPALDAQGADYPRANDPIISPLSFQAIGNDYPSVTNTAVASAAYVTTNRAIFYPFHLAHPFLVRKMFWVNGTVVGTDSIDVGVYTESGTRLLSTGGTLSAGVGLIQEIDVTDFLLRPGRYYMGFAQNGTTATTVAILTSAVGARMCGLVEMQTAYVLPATATYATIGAVATLPIFGIAQRTLVL
jgi:hypothetical protein